MAAVAITFIGGADAGNVGSTTWGTAQTGEIEFPLNRAVVLDPEQTRNAPQRAFIEHVIRKARGNKYFTVEDAKENSAPAELPQHKPPAKKGK